MYDCLRTVTLLASLLTSELPVFWYSAKRFGRACVLMAPALWPFPARAAEPVDVAMVLVTDVSRSIDDGEFDIEKTGYAAAFNSPEVLAAIRGGARGSIAVSYFEFASASEVKQVIDWTVIRDSGSARSFAERLTSEPRSFYGRTAISTGIDAAVRALAEAPVDALRRVIDVCGDGTANAGRDLTAARDDALAAGAVINGLAIINEHPMDGGYAHVQPPGGLANYYRENLAGGFGSFVLEIRDFHAFAEGMTHKLVSEIAETVPSDRKVAASR